MPPGQTAQTQFQTAVPGRNAGRGVGSFRRYVDTARATHGQLAIVFGVNVQEKFSLHPAGFQAQSSGHAGFFVHRNQQFQGRVDRAGVRQKG